MREKYIGKIYDGRWEVIRFERYGSNSKAGKFVLRNIYNGSEVSFKDSTLRKIDSGKTTVSYLRYKRLKTIKRKEGELDMSHKRILSTNPGQEELWGMAQRQGYVYVRLESGTVMKDMLDYRHFMTETSTYHVRLTQKTYGREWALTEGELNEHLREND